MWETLHWVAAGYPEEPSAEDMYHVQTLLELYTRLTPCSKCRAHFADLVAEKPPRADNELSAREPLQRYMLMLHNAVNESAGSRTMTWDEYSAKYNDLVEPVHWMSPVVASLAVVVVVLVVLLAYKFA